MFTRLAALGIGIVTTLGAPAIALADCDPAHPTTGYPPHARPVPAPAYAPAPAYTPAPPYARPRVPPRVVTPPQHIEVSAVAMRRADQNRDGGVTLAEARAYGRTQFVRADHDRNGVLTRRELRRSRTELLRVSQGHGPVVTPAELDAGVREQFYRLDTNRDGFLSRFELGTAPAPRTVTYSWRWSL